MNGWISRRPQRAFSGARWGRFVLSFALALFHVPLSTFAQPVPTFTYTYDALGNRTSLTDRFGLHTFGYDRLNRLLTADHPLTSRLVDEGLTQR